jgi:alkyl hydroperoxide reductase subunit F
MLDLIIAGGGPAGAAAGVYAARKKLKTAIVTEDWGGQSNVSPDVQNWIGTPSLSGNDLAKQLRAHVEAYASPCVEVILGTRVKSLQSSAEAVSVSLENGSELSAKALLVATGARRRDLTIKGAKEFNQKGLTYCASCDGPLFSDKDVVVIGGGNAGFETAAQLLAYTKSVTLITRDSFRADKVTVEKVLSHPNMTGIENAEPTEVLGETFVSGLKWKKTGSGAEQTLPVSGIFVEIGLIPNTAWVEHWVVLNEHKQIVVDPRTQRASALSRSTKNTDGTPPLTRVWAAGDCTDALYHQNNIAAGDAVKALEDIYNSLHAR